MKDQQIAAKAAEPRIFLVSPILHCVSMPALVYLRSSFGYAYLRPKSVFFAITWALALYAIYAWIDGNVWREYRAVLWFGTGAAALYWLHLAVTVRREWNETAEHDHFSGVSNLKRFFGKRNGLSSAAGKEKFRLWGEPLAVATLAQFVRAASHEQHLSRWLWLTALCLWVKEALNQWFNIRHRKRRRDISEDAKDSFEDQTPKPSMAQSLPSPSARKEKVYRSRQRSSSLDDTSEEKR